MVFNEGGQENLSDIMNSRGKSKPANLHLKFHAPDILRRRSTSTMWDAAFDPFQVFEVEHEACLDFEVTIKSGESITKGSMINDLLDTPDPYVVLRIPGCSNSSKRTSHIDNCVSPMWDETFHFFLDPCKEHTLKVTLMDANYTLDETLGEDTFCVNELTNGVPKDHTFVFPGGSKVHAQLKLDKNKVPDLRFSLALCREEKEYLLTRRKKVLAALQSLLGDRAPDTEKQVPILGILGSGGGFRAMTCLSGAVKALQESHILDCATYIAGLSGSSWYISTLYAHDIFPRVTHTQIQAELRESVTKGWKMKLLNAPKYIASMAAKYKKGQPVSFTDFFGHLLGDVLLKGAKHKKLTDMQKFLVQGIVPMPLFTCLHAKRNVSCRSFSEWVEFSPYEIGIAKYGTFMKTQDFGNKFIVGKKIKHFDELPLHFLQGVWGSAFTILFKRLVMEGGKKDIVQIMRDAQKEKESDIRDRLNDEHASEEESDSEDEEDVVGEDDVSEEDLNGDFRTPCAVEPGRGGGNVFFPKEDAIPEGRLVSNRKFSAIEEGQSLDANFSLFPKEDFSKSVDSLSLDDSKKDEDKKLLLKGLSFDSHKKKLLEDSRRKISTESDPGVKTEFQLSQRGRLERKGAIKGSRKMAATDEKNSQGSNNDSKNRYWANRRSTLRKNKVVKKGLWDGLKESIMTGANILNSRAGRAGEVLNPFRGLSLRHSFPISPFTESLEEEELPDELDIGKGCRYEALDNKAKKLFIVDSGLAFNSPYPLLLRPQRAVDIYLSFDFSQRPEDKHHPFKELLLAESWAVQNKVPFPPIKKMVEQYKNEELRECYIFKHPSDYFCPIILHFPLVNKLFRTFKKPGVPRETDEEKKFADFPIFDDPNNPFSSMNFVYEPLQFDRLTQLVEFNTLLCIETIKDELAEIITRKRQYAQKPMSISDVVNTVKRVNSIHRFSSNNTLKLKLSEENEFQLKNFIKEERTKWEQQFSVDSSEEGEFFDAEEDVEDKVDDS
ncbi:cytosolic phospholipase A2-like isoform X2 [Macrobrachium nipponense]|uniref:cytosolic phospholipase A2-like isoform X2 n=1 Tax=Macrobrachium nipponense TaxID=159736 RepID=UPI0030C7CEE9